jgi:hypothetical protein
VNEGCTQDILPGWRAPNCCCINYCCRVGRGGIRQPLSLSSSLCPFHSGSRLCELRSSRGVHMSGSNRQYETRIPSDLTIYWFPLLLSLTGNSLGADMLRGFCHSLQQTVWTVLQNRPRRLIHVLSSPSFKIILPFYAKYLCREESVIK